MARIETYKKDTQLGLDDFLLGSDADNINVTRNYLLRGIFSTFKNSLGLSSIEYIFAGSGDPELNEEDRGYFTTNSNTTLAGAISTIRINKNDLNNISIESIITTIEDNISSFMLTLFKPSSSGQIFYFKVTDIVDSGSYYTLDVENFVGGNYLIDGTTYTLNFDLAGVPSELTESDPIFTASPSYNITNIDISSWNTAYSWGDHSVAGYQSKLSGDGIVKSSSGVISYLPDNSTNWNTAYSWGDHSIVGYLMEESDPVFIASPASSISTLKISQWDTAFGWGDHSMAGYLTSFTESDPIFTGSVAYNINQGDVDSWNAAYSWGDHASIGYLRSDEDGILDGKLWINGAISGQEGSGADLQVNGFMRTGNIFIHSGGSSPTDEYSNNSLSNDAGILKWTGYTVWTSGNDGAGSGLDADTLDGLDSSQFLRSDTDATIYGTLTIDAGANEPLRIHGSGLKSDSTAKNLVIGKDSAGDNLWYVGYASTSGNDLYLYNYVGANYIRLLDDGGKDGLYYNYSGGFGKVWHSGNDGAGSGLDADKLDGYHLAGTTNYGNSWGYVPLVKTDGVMEVGKYIDFHESSGDSDDYDARIYSNGGVIRMGELYTSERVTIDGGASGDILLYFNTDRPWYFMQGGDDANDSLVLKSSTGGKFFKIRSSTDLDVFYIHSDTGNVSTRGDVAVSGALTRTAHNSGYLEGSYNNVGGNSAQSNPIYVIGSNYVPSTTTIGDMYGIGFCTGGASFIGSTDLGTAPNTSAWGLYVAADGNARVFLDASLGRGYFKSNVYAADFITHSDRRKKENIRDAEIIDKPIQWRTFDKREEWGGDKDKYGVIAQELQETHPQFVDDNDPDALSVRYTDLFAHELAKKDKQVKELEDRVERLEALVEILIKEK